MSEYGFRATGLQTMGRTKPVGLGLDQLGPSLLYGDTVELPQWTGNPRPKLFQKLLYNLGFLD